MSANSGWLVLLDRDQFAVAHVVRGTIERSDGLNFDATQSGETAATIARLLEERGHAGQPIALALGSSEVVTTTVQVPSRKALKRSAIGFLVEPYLPWSAEDSIIDFERAGPERVFVVAVEAAPLRELIAALDERGILVASIFPVARLALECHLEPGPSLAPRYALLWGGAEMIDLWLLEDDRPVIWRWLPQHLSEVVRSLKQIALCEKGEFVLVGRNLPEGFLTSLSELTRLETRDVAQVDSDDPFVCAVRETIAVLGGRRESPIELCRDQLAPADRHRSIRRQLRLLQLSLVLLMAIVALAAGYKGMQTESLRADCQARQAKLFQSLFPKEKVPVAVTTRLTSEVTRLKGVRGESTGLPQLTPSVGVLERLFQAFPDSMRFRLLEIRILNGQLYLVGQAREHGDADRIAEGLRAAGLDVGSPNTHRLEKGGVEFRISARLIPPPAQKAMGRSA